MDHDQLPETKRPKPEVGPPKPEIDRPLPVSLKRLGHLDAKTTVLFVCDVQERFGPAIPQFAAVVENVGRMIKVAKMMDMAIFVTEQYPKGLGRTVPELRILLNGDDGGDGGDQSTSTSTSTSGQKYVAKTRFSMLVDETESRLADLKESQGVDTVLVCGLETHVCVRATCLDLVARGFNVHVIADASSSRSATDRQMALAHLRDHGVFINTVESAALNLVGDAGNPVFKKVSSLIRVLCPDTGLIPDSRPGSELKSTL